TMIRRTTYLTLGLGFSSLAAAEAQGPGSLSPTKWPAGEEARFWQQQGAVRTAAGVASGKRGAVTVAYGAYAARAGLEALERGGNAIDAALTTALTQVALTAGSPISYFGILSLAYYDAKSGQVTTMNATWNTVLGETSPLTIPGKIDLSDEGKLGTATSGRTALVGGFMKGVEAAHKRYGKLPFALLFEPAIHVAEDGMLVTKSLASIFAMRAKDLARLPATRAIFLKPDGTTYKEGETFRQPALAATLRQVAAKGADYMYRGPWAERLVSAVQADGGKMSLEDLSSYDVLWAPPIMGRVGDYDIATLGPPNYGGVGLIEAQNLAVAAGLKAKGHWSKSGAALRTAVTITQGWILSLLPPEYAHQILPSLDLSPQSRLTQSHAEAYWKEIEAGKLPSKWAEDGPKHSDDVVAVDQDGNMVALTQSINCVFWGKTAINIDGISIGDPASFQQAQIAETGPGKRLPDPTETGILLKSGKPVLAFASMGAGLHQRMFQGLQNFAVYGMTVDQAIDAPDFFLPNLNSAAGGYVVMVPAGRFPKAVLDGMGIRYEEVGQESARFGGEGVWVAISRDPKTGELRAASHNRSNSAAVAY
ncbi:MAG: gamma-glutamyltransferase, partial [Gemmatimonadota bacterium]